MRTALIPKEVYALSKDDASKVMENLNHWQWDPRIGKEPFMFQKLEHYKKSNNIRYRLENLFRCIWPFTKADYIQPIRHEILKMYPDLKHEKAPHVNIYS